MCETQKENYFIVDDLPVIAWHALFRSCCESVPSMLGGGPSSAFQSTAAHLPVTVSGSPGPFSLEASPFGQASWRQLCPVGPHSHLRKEPHSQTVRGRHEFQAL